MAVEDTDRKLDRIIQMLVSQDTRIAELKAEHVSIQLELAKQNQALVLMNESQEHIDKRLEKVEQACAADHGPSPLLEPVQQIAAEMAATRVEMTKANARLAEISDSVEDQSAAFDRLRESLNGKGGGQ